MGEYLVLIDCGVHGFAQCASSASLKTAKLYARELAKGRDWEIISAVTGRAVFASRWVKYPGWRR